MNNEALQNLPPELQERINGIVAAARATPPVPNGVPTNAPPERAPVVRQPSVMDHLVALRQEVDEMKQQVMACAQVVNAVGEAVGQMYQAFQPTPQPNTYSQNFQTSQEEDY